MEPDSPPPRDTPEQKPAPSPTGEAERVKVSKSVAVARGLSERFRESASSVLELALQFEESEKELELNMPYVSKQIVELKEKEERLKVAEEKQRKFEDSINERLDVVQEKEKEADVMRLVAEMQIKEVVTQLKEEEKSLGLLKDSMAKKHEGLVKELEAGKEAVALFSKSMDDKSCKLVMAVKEFEMKQTAETEKMKKEAEQIEARKEELNTLNETIEKKSIQLKKKEERFQLKQKAGARKMKEKIKLLVIKEKELKERVKMLKLKQEDLEEGSKTRKRSRLEFGASSLAEKGIDAVSIIPPGKKRKFIREHNCNVEEKKETDLACVLHGKTSSDLVAEHTSEAIGREIADEDPEPQEFSDFNNGLSTSDAKGREIVCRDEVDEDHEPFNCPDPEFNDFSKTINSFSLGQLWALYDPTDGMPRYYAWVKKVLKSELSVRVTWVESVVPTAANEKKIPIACGRFKNGASHIVSLSMFSHKMHYRTIPKNIIINPRKGETWAMFRDWSKTWNTHREQHKPPYRYDFVEILTKLDKEHAGIGVAFLGKVEGFTSVYKQAEQHGLIQLMISSDEMFRFSHRVPSIKMTGDEKDGVPAGSFELDPAAIPQSLV